MKFSVTTYTTQGIILPEDLIPKLAEWGYDGIELWGGRLPPKQGEPKWGLEGRSLNEIRKLRKIADDYGLEIPAVSTYFKFTESEESYRRSLKTGVKYCEIANLVGAGIIRVVGEGVPSSQMTEEKWRVFIRGLKDLAALGDKYNVTFGLELHSNTPHDTVLGQLRCIWQTSSERVRTLYQPTTISTLEPELDQLWALEKLYPYIVHVHIATDSSFKCGTLRSRGNGHVHWSQILGELKRRGYSGFISIEGVPQPKLKNLKKEIEWLKFFS
ncbi:sugar phosphate isomerase/epimerase [Candidatus Bathyarchaeota archaeon]|nr:MAG: sugar phosphate isomerase/epimerase [Candidatus Bathyarchaeota archaeon]